ncbi:hypothetical protein LAZ67_14001051 [Cordylochernes scorpioides]|uniref:Transposase n=1 Tax=Cordylochernes scorpioides TaxID=51811 RepID=A0ABY6L6Q1_9ARAC|nr:hypothetical protein LAZ67_14001051 [Cordylochernes scorpioides]
MRKLCQSWMQHLLNADQNQIRKQHSQQYFARVKRDPTVRRFVNKDETWVHHCTPETKQQSKQWAEAVGFKRQRKRIQSHLPGPARGVYSTRSRIYVRAFLTFHYTRPPPSETPATSIYTGSGRPAFHRTHQEQCIVRGGVIKNNVRAFLTIHYTRLPPSDTFGPSRPSTPAREVQPPTRLPYPRHPPRLQIHFSSPNIRLDPVSTTLSCRPFPDIRQLISLHQIETSQPPTIYRDAQYKEGSIQETLLTPVPNKRRIHTRNSLNPSPQKEKNPYKKLSPSPNKRRILTRNSFAPAPNKRRILIRNFFVPAPNKRRIHTKILSPQPPIREGFLQETLSPQPPTREGSLQETLSPQPLKREGTIQENISPQPPTREGSTQVTLFTPAPKKRRNHTRKYFAPAPNKSRIHTSNSSHQPPTREGSIQETFAPASNKRRILTRNSFALAPNKRRIHTRNSIDPCPKQGKGPYKKLSPQPPTGEESIQETISPQLPTREGSIQETLSPQPPTREGSTQVTLFTPAPNKRRIHTSNSLHPSPQQEKDPHNKEDEEKMWTSQEKRVCRAPSTRKCLEVFIDRFQRRGREINSPAGAVVKEGAEIAVGLKEKGAPLPHTSASHRVQQEECTARGPRIYVRAFLTFHYTRLPPSDTLATSIYTGSGRPASHRVHQEQCIDLAIHHGSISRGTFQGRPLLSHPPGSYEQCTIALINPHHKTADLSTLPPTREGSIQETLLILGPKEDSNAYNKGRSPYNKESLQSWEFQPSMSYERKNTSRVAEWTRHLPASKWFKIFREGDISLEDKPRMERPHGTDIETLRLLVMDNLQQSTREMSSRLGPSKDMINRTLHKLYFVNKCPKKYPHDLTIAQSQREVDICKRLLENPQDLRKRIVTGDEKRIYLRNLDPKRQWVQFDQEAKPVVKQDRFGHKVMLSVWWNIDGIVHYQLVSDDRVVKSDLDSEQLSRVYEVLKTQYPALINRKRVLLQHDNAPAHRDRLTTNRIKDLEGIEVLPSALLIARILRHLIMHYFGSWLHFKGEDTLKHSKTSKLSVIVRFPLDPVWISWNKVRPRLTRAITLKPWSLGGRFSVYQS